MKKIGLTAEELSNFGFAEYQHAHLDIIEEFEKSEHPPPIVGTPLNETSNEAVILAVAKMIEKNNRVLLEQLKQLGVVQESE